MPILKQHRFDNAWTAVPNNTLQREDLTYEAKGLLCELLSRPEDWKVQKSQLKRKHTGSTKIDRIFKELREKGFLFIYSERDPETKSIVDRFWIVSPLPLDKEQFQASLSLNTENLKLRGPQVKETLIQGNQQLQINNNTNIDNNTNKEKTFSLTVEFLFEKCIELFKERKPQYLKNLTNGYEDQWKDCFRLMIEVDRRDPDEIEKILEHMTDVSKSWWAETDNIRSPLKLRKRNRDKVMYYDVLLSEMQRKPKKSQNYHQAEKSGWAEAAMKDLELQRRRNES